MKLKSLTKKFTATILSLAMIWTGAELFNVAAATQNEPESVVMEENKTIEEQLSTFLCEKVNTQDAVAVLDDVGTAPNEVALRMNDGTVSVYCFSEPIKYEDENGEVHFKETAIVAQDNKDFSYANGDNEFSIGFSEDVDKGIKIVSANADNELTLIPVQNEGVEKLDGKSKEIVNADHNTEDVFTYENVFGEGSRIEYSPQLNGLKENIVLDQYTGQNTFDFVLGTHGNIAELVDGQIIEIKDRQTGEVINTLLPLFAYDSYCEGEYSTDPAHYTEDCTYTLTEQENGVYKLTVTVSEEWLTAPTTIYPVTIDPTITENYTGMDCALYSANPNTVYNNTTNNTGYNSTYGKGRAMFKFAMPAAIPTGAQITGAKYYFRETAAKSDTSYVGVHMINSVANGWTSSVATWNKYYNACDEQLDRRNINSTSTDVSGSPYWYKFNIVKAVQKWINGQAPNRGVMLISESESTIASWRAWASIRHGTSSYKPYANIMYEVDTTPPTVTVIGNPTTWTNKDVILTAIATDTGSGVKDYSFASTSSAYTAQTDSTYKVETNKTVYVRAQDYANNPSPATAVVVSKIDKAVPTIQSVTGNPTVETNQDVTLTVNATDTGGSGIAKYLFDGAESATKNNKKVYTTNKSNIKITVVDAAGNTSAAYTVSITNINKDKTDFDPPSITLSTSNIQTKSATIKTVIIDDDSGVAIKKWASGSRAVAYFEDNGTEFTGDAFAVTASGTYTVYAEDAQGNSAVKTISVTLSMTTIAAPTFTANNNVLTISYPANATQKFYREGSGQWRTYTEPLVMKAGIKVYARASVEDRYTDSEYTPTISGSSLPAIYEKDGLIYLLPTQNRNTTVVKKGAGSHLEWVAPTWAASDGRKLNLTTSTTKMSPDLGDDESSSIMAVINVPVNAINPVFSFYYNISSEQDADYLHVSLEDEGRVILSESGEKDWTLCQVTLSPGQHVLKFEYAKNGENSGGLDRAYLDDFTLTYDIPGTDGLQYKIDDSPYQSYTSPFEIERNVDVTVYAKEGNGQEVSKLFTSMPGSFTLENNDMKVESPGLTISFDRSYDSKDEKVGSFGKGWSFAYDCSVTDYAMTSNGSAVQNNRIKTVVMPGGGEQDFIFGADGIYHSLQSNDTLAVYPNRIVVTTEDKYKVTYDQNGTLVSITDNNGNVTTFARSGNKLTITDCVNRQYTVTYSSGRIVSIADPLQNTVQYTYDNNGQLASFIDQAGVTFWQYGYTNGKISIIKNAANVAEQTVSYDTDGRVSEIGKANGSGESYTYFGSSMTVTDRNNFTSSVIYNNRLRSERSIDIDDKVTNYTYSTSGNEYIESESADGKLTRHFYDAATMRLKKVEYPVTEEGIIPTQTYLYDNRGRVIREKSTDNQYTYTAYDTNNNVTATAVLSFLDEDQTAPASLAQASADVRASMDITVNVYSAEPVHGINGLVEHVHSGGQCVEYVYNEQGNIQSTGKKKLQDGVHGEADWYTVHDVNLVGQDQVVWELGKRYDTDENGNETVNLVLEPTGYTYDLVGRVLRESAVKKTQQNTRYLYDVCGRQIQQIDKEQYVEAADGLNATPKTNTYANTNVGQRNVYAQNGNLLKEIDSQNRETAYAYDAVGNVTSKAFPNGMVQTYDIRQRLTVEVFGNNVFDRHYGYNEDYLVSSVTGRNHSDTYTYSDQKITSTTSQYGTAPAVTTDYTYAGENITSITVSGTEKVRYTYGKYSELLREDNKYINKTVVYTYDDAGNILLKKEYTYTTDEDLAGKTPTATINYTYSAEEGKENFLTSYNGKSVTSDEKGNMLTYDNWTFTWSLKGTLTGQSKVGTSLSYTYNDDGIRTSKTVNGVTTTYTLEEGKVVTETKGSQVISYTYDSYDDLVYMTVGGQNYFYKRNIQNDITDLLDSNMNVVAHYTYDTWGKLVSITGSNTTLGNLNPYRYRGYRYDTETGMYYLQSRYYDPEIGRFISRDSIEDTGNRPWGKNRFAYCDNNPGNGYDPYGYSSLQPVRKVTTQRLISTKYAKTYLGIVKKKWTYILSGWYSTKNYTMIHASTGISQTMTISAGLGLSAEVVNATFGISLSVSVSITTIADAPINKKYGNYARITAWMDAYKYNIAKTQTYEVTVYQLYSNGMQEKLYTYKSYVITNYKVYAPHINLLHYTVQYKW